MSASWFFEVFPSHPAPYPGECLSGYLLRLAEANGLPHFGQLISDLFPTWQKAAQISLLRWEYPLNAWGRIPLRAQVSPTALERTTVLPWIAKFRALPEMTRPGHLGPGHFLRGIVHPHLQICPLCLQAQPYVRLLWRLVPIRACVRHGCLLQTHCHQCGAPLSAIGVHHRHLRCPTCDADLRQTPVVDVPQDMWITQQRRQADLQFLLDPDTTLIDAPDWEGEDLTRTLRQAIGLKFRYLRAQTGLSAKETSRQVGVTEYVITSLETGKYAPLPLYVTYLEHLSWTWADFAALEVPPLFVQSLSEIKHMPLRICPAPECPNHISPPSTRVHLIQDSPELQRARFRCATCGRYFARTYDGELVTRPKNPPFGPGEQPPLTKPPEEIALLIQLGLQGEDNYKIAERLGWAQKTVHWYWIVLSIEEQVHQAQAQRREREKQQRHAALRVRLGAVLQTMIEKDEEITLRGVSLALGYSADYLGPDRDCWEYVLQVAQSHNPQVRQRRHEVLEARITALLDELQRSDEEVTMAEIVQRVGICYRVLHMNYPELHAQVRQTVQEQKVKTKAQQKEKLRIRIDAAAGRLIDQGKKLTTRAIAREAGLNTNNIYSKQTVLELLYRWTGGSG
jgi:DNA-binding XRE family transcriptional regulator